jgi:hypothetical protein
MNLPPKVPRLKWITFTMAARYVRAHHHFSSCTRQTIHNWAKLGVMGEKMKSVRHGFMYKTTKEWVDDFLSRIPNGTIQTTNRKG